MYGVVRHVVDMGFHVAPRGRELHGKVFGCREQATCHTRASVDSGAAKVRVASLPQALIDALRRERCALLCTGRAVITCFNGRQSDEAVTATVASASLLG